MPRAALLYIINSGLNPDVTFAGKFELDHVYENIPAYYHPEISDEETGLLKKLRKVAKVSAQFRLPGHHKFLEKLAPDSPEEGDLQNSV